MRLARELSSTQDLPTTLLGTVESWDEVFAVCEVHGAAHLDYSGTDDFGMAVWQSTDEAWFARTADDPRAWRPEHSVLLKMVDSAGELIGVVSVDMPHSGLQFGVYTLLTSTGGWDTGRDIAEDRARRSGAGGSS